MHKIAQAMTLIIGSDPEPLVEDTEFNERSESIKRNVLILNLRNCTHTPQ
jgi:hypothetical protein